MNNLNKISVEESKEWIEYFLKIIQESNICYFGSFQDGSLERLLKLLKQRLEQSKKSFLLLYQSNFFNEAMIVSGYMLETSALISNIETCKNKEKTLKTLYADAAYQTVYRFLSTSPELDKNNWNIEYEKSINELEKYSSVWFKKTKEEIESEANITSDIVMSFLKNKGKSNEEKKSFLTKHYKNKNIKEKIISFLKEAEILLKTMNINSTFSKDVLYDFYNLYCSYKHNNLLSFIDNSTFVSAKMGCILSLISYYRENGEIKSLIDKVDKALNLTSQHKQGI